MSAKQERWPYAEAPALPRAYFDSVRRAGGEPLMLDARPFTIDDAHALLSRVDALVLTGGPDVDPAYYGQQPHPATYGVDREADDYEILLARAALERGTRTLAICRGTQVLNVALGGTLYQHIEESPGVAAHGRPGEPGGHYAHDVAIEAGSQLADVLGTQCARCSCHHHQAVDQVGTGLRVSARAGDDIVEALEY